MFAASARVSVGGASYAVNTGQCASASAAVDSLRRTVGDLLEGALAEEKRQEQLGMSTKKRKNSEEAYSEAKRPKTEQGAAAMDVDSEEDDSGEA